MKAFSCFDLYFLVKELKVLENQRIDNFYLVEDIFYIQVFLKRNSFNLDFSEKLFSQKYLRISCGKYLFLSNFKPAGTFPVNFIVFLRKYLRNAYIKKISQVNFERILKIEIEKKVEDKFVIYFLYVELFSNGNIVLCNCENVILNCFIKKNFKDRSLFVNKEYVLPPNNNFFDFEKLDLKIFEDLIKDCSDFNISSFLAIKFGFGGKYSKQICFLSNIDLNFCVKDLDKSMILVLIENVKKVLGFNILAKGYFKDKKLVDFSAFDFLNYDFEKENFENFNLVLEKYYLQFEQENKKDIIKSDFDLKLKKLNSIYNSQKKFKEEILEKSKNYSIIADKIYENYSLIDNLLKSILKGLKEKDENEILDRISNDKFLSQIVKKVDFKNQKIIIDLE